MSRNGRGPDSRKIAVVHDDAEFIDWCRTRIAAIWQRAGGDGPPPAVDVFSSSADFARLREGEQWREYQVIFLDVNQLDRDGRESLTRSGAEFARVVPCVLFCSRAVTADGIPNNCYVLRHFSFDGFSRACRWVFHQVFGLKQLPPWIAAEPPVVRGGCVLPAGDGRHGGRDDPDPAALDDLIAAARELEPHVLAVCEGLVRENLQTLQARSAAGPWTRFDAALGRLQEHTSESCALAKWLLEIQRLAEHLRCLPDLCQLLEGKPADCRSHWLAAYRAELSDFRERLTGLARGTPPWAWEERR
jgi:hypothetical protein